MGSHGAEIAAASRGNRIQDGDDKDYQVILPALPTGRTVVNTVFLHGDLRARPFRVEDFRDAIAQTGKLNEVVALGAYQVNHVWAVTLNSPEATKRLLSVNELLVKGRRCLIIDPENQQTKLKLHWVLHGVTDEDIRSAFAPFGMVTEAARERWRVHGVDQMGSTTRTVLLKLKAGTTVSDLPHQIKIAGGWALVVVPGRPMQCLRCKGSGHVRRECKVPYCPQCRRYGHSDAQCVRSYATVTGPGNNDEVADHLMDTTEAEEAAQGTGESESPAVNSPASPHDSQDAQAAGDLGTQAEVEVPAPDEEPANGGASRQPAESPAQSQVVGVQQRAKAASANTAVKRCHPEVKDGSKTETTKAEEPPSKAAPLRLSGLRQRSSLPRTRGSVDDSTGGQAPPDGDAPGVGGV